MNKPRVEKLIEALRSESYPQGRNRLKTIDDRFCCLGVCADLARETLGGEWTQDNFGNPLFSLDDRSYRVDLMGWNHKNGNIERPIADYFGLADEDEHQMMRMNDNGKSFNEIADWLEAKLGEKNA